MRFSLKKTTLPERSRLEQFGSLEKYGPSDKAACVVADFFLLPALVVWCMYRVSHRYIHTKWAPAGGRKVDAVVGDGGDGKILTKSCHKITCRQT